MGRRESKGEGVRLGEVRVRPVRDAEERRRWDELVARDHYLRFKGLFGKGLRHVAEQGEAWLALVGWQAGAFKIGVRDKWIGWTAEQQFQRLHLIANNARFTVLEGGRVANLASRVLGLSLGRVAGDMQALHGYRVLLAETMVDPSRFAGTCYRASNWQSLGLTRGFSRAPGGTARWRRHGQPKEVLVFPLAKHAREALCADEAPEEGQVGEKAEPMAAAELHSLYRFLDDMPDFRKPRGVRYGLACYLAIMIAARLAGYRGITAFGQFAKQLDPEQLKAVGAFWSPTCQRYTAPAASTFHYILSSLPGDTLERALRDWSRQHSDPARPVAMDGKDIRGASKQLDDGRRIMVAAVEHGSGLVLGQTQVDDKSNEIPAVRQLSRSLALSGRLITLDAMHVQQETARCLLDDCGADYLVTAVKQNQPSLLEDLKVMDWREAPGYETPWEKAHGRIEQRRCAVIDVTDPLWDGTCMLYGRRQALRIERQRHLLKSGKTSAETVYCLTSLGPEKAGPKELLALVRDHWQVENRLHYVRDVTYDEDRCRARVGNLPRNLAALTNAAISIVRCGHTFDYMPNANRYFAARTQHALDTILNPHLR